MSLEPGVPEKVWVKPSSCNHAGASPIEYRSGGESDANVDGENVKSNGRETRATGGT